MKQIKLLILFCLLAMQAMAQDAKPVMAVLGDSYSTFEGYMHPADNLSWYRPERVKEGKTDVDKVEQTWWWLLANENDLELGVNNSYSGATISHRGYEGKDYSDRSYITRSADLGNPDYILVFGGTNDSWAGTKMGKYVWKNQTDAQLRTFRPSVAKVMQLIKKTYPKAKAYYIINTELRPEVAEAFKVCAKHYGVTAIELHDIDKISGHPSVKGMRQIADQLTEAIFK